MLREDAGRFGPVGQDNSLSGFGDGAQEQAGRVQEDEGRIGREGPARAPRRQNFHFPLLLSPVGRMLSPLDTLFFAQQDLARTFIFLGNFNILVSEHSFSFEF